MMSDAARIRLRSTTDREKLSAMNTCRCKAVHQSRNTCYTERKNNEQWPCRAHSWMSSSLAAAGASAPRSVSNRVTNFGGV